MNKNGRFHDCMIKTALTALPVYLERWYMHTVKLPNKHNSPIMGL